MTPDRPTAAAFRLTDATNRAVRTALQMGAVLAAIAVVDAVQSWASGQPFAWRVVLGAAIAAFAAPFAALLHRLVLDPSSIPSATPPTPPTPPVPPPPLIWPSTGSTNGTAPVDSPADDKLVDALAADFTRAANTPPVPLVMPPATDALADVDDVDLDIPPAPAKARAARADAAAEVRQAKATKKAAPAKKAAAKKQPAKKDTPAKKAAARKR